MSLLVGGGSLASSKDAFPNEVPTSLLVRDNLSMEVTNPLPPTPPEPVENNVQSINFIREVASGFVLTTALPTVQHGVLYSGGSATLNTSLANLRIRTSQGTWLGIQARIYDGENWQSIPLRVYSGTEWV